MLLEAGFDRVDIFLKEQSREVIKEWIPGSGAEDFIVSANITAWKAAASAGGYLAFVETEKATSTAAAQSNQACCAPVPAQATQSCCPPAAPAASEEPKAAGC